MVTNFWMREDRAGIGNPGDRKPKGNGDIPTCRAMAYPITANPGDRKPKGNGDVKGLRLNN